MRLESAELIVVEIPMRFSVSHTLATRKTARNLILRLTTEEGEVGWGECCPRDYVTGETIESCVRDISETFVPDIAGQEFQSFNELSECLEGILKPLGRDRQAAFCAVELALLDLAGKTFGHSAGVVVGPLCHETVKYSGVIATDDPAKVSKYAQMMKLFQVDAVKVKTGGDLETNVSLLKTAREILGADVSLRIDANAAWDADEAIRQLKILAQYHLQGVEQPVRADDIDGMRTVTAARVVPVVADESLCSFEDAQNLGENSGCDIFNLRISKCGGLLNSKRIYELAHDHGLRCQMGAQVGEFSILSAAGRQFATRAPDLIWLEGSYGTILLEDDIADPVISVGPMSTASALTGDGLGVNVLQEKVDAFATSRMPL